MRAPSLLAKCLPGLAPHDRVAQSMSIASDKEMHLPSPAGEILPSKMGYPYRYAGESIDWGGVNLFKGRVSVSDIIGSELISSKHDASLKSWDSAFDLVNILKHEIRDGQLSFRGKRVLETQIWFLVMHFKYLLWELPCSSCDFIYWIIFQGRWRHKTSLFKQTLMANVFLIIKYSRVRKERNLAKAAIGKMSSCSDMSSKDKRLRKNVIMFDALLSIAIGSGSYQILFCLLAYDIMAFIFDEF